MRGEGSKGEKGVGGYCSGGTCHNDRPGLKGGEDKSGDEDGIEVEWGCGLQGGTCDNDKPGLNSGGDWGRV